MPQRADHLSFDLAECITEAVASAVVSVPRAVGEPLRVVQRQRGMDLFPIRVTLIPESFVAGFRG